MISISIDDKLAGKRLDVALVASVPGINRSSMQKLIKMGKVQMDNTIVKSNYIVKLGDQITVDHELINPSKLKKVDLPIVFEDDDVIVIIKPVGMLSHSKGVFNPEFTVANWLNSKVPDMKGERSGIVHRLDRATSGVMILAKNDKSMKWLQKQFSTRKVKKTYIAAIEGEIEPKSAIIDMPIQRNPKEPAKFRVSPNGKASITKYLTLITSDNVSLLELSPESGRTHQLRVHLANLNKPIIGDNLYGGKAADRLYLHAKKIELTLPNRQRLIFEAPLPDTFKEMVG